MSTLSQFVEEAPPTGSVDPVSLLDSIDAPSSRTARLPSGRVVEISATADGDRVEIRARTGRVLLRVFVDDRGPLLDFEDADLRINTSRDLALRGRDVSIEAARDLHVAVAGDRHSAIGGADRLEAGVLEMQANAGNAALRARGEVRIDAERIGLNDDPLPAPFPWSQPAKGDADVR